MSSGVIRCSANATAFGLRRQCKARKLATTVVCSAKKNYYKVLSLDSEDAGAEDIKKAYRRLALRCHPDVCPPSRRVESTAMFLELRRAYETLSDPALRTKHDTELRLGGRGEAAAVAAHRTEFVRDVWEAQLRVLRVRSDQREKARRKGKVHACI